jgi:hypothetical protein
MSLARSPRGGHILVDAAFVGMANTIVAGNQVSTISGTKSFGPDVGGVIASGGYNLIGAATNSSGWGGTDRTGTSAAPLDPLLAPPGDYGGPTPTMALLPGSPALDAGDPGFATPGATDQRGLPRVADGRLDIGAFESQGFSMTVSGSPQSIPINTTFASPLQVAVTANDPGVSVAGGRITFSAPATGASATLATPSVTLDAAGVAATTATAGGTQGSYAVTASAGGNNVTTFSLTNTVAPAFSGLSSATIVYGTATATLGGHLAAGAFCPPAGEAVSITVNGVTQTATLDSGGSFSLTFDTAALGVAGSPYPITYQYGGDPTFTGVSDSSATLTVTQATPTVSWANPADVVYGTALDGTQLDATASALVNGSTVSLPGTFTYTLADGSTPAAGAVFTAGANRTLLVNFTPTDTADFTAASGSTTITVAQATPTLTWANPADIVYGTPLSATQFDATADVAGTFTYCPVAGTVLGAGTQTLSVTFTPDDTFDYSGVTLTATLDVLKATPTVTWAEPADVTYGTPLMSTQLDASANVPGAFTYTPAAGTVLGAGSHTLSVTFTPDDTADCNSVTQTATLTVLQATPTVTWADPAAIVYGTALSSTQLNATADLPGTFTYTPAGGTVLGAGTRTLSVLFTPTDTTDYTTATATTQLTVAQALLTVTANDAARSYGVADPSFTATLTGFSNGQTPASSGITGSPSLSTTATAASPPGSYAISAGLGSLASANYAFAFVNGTLTVTAAPLTATGVNFLAPAGGPYSGPVATFANPDPVAGTASYTATITWGDGSSSAGVISDNGNGTFSVTGTHTYTNPASYAVGVLLVHNQGFTTPATTASTATVVSLATPVQPGMVAGPAFWAGQGGQALILNFDSGPNSTTLADWLAATLPNLFGAAAGAFNLTGMSNAEVAVLYQWLRHQRGRKLEAEVLAVALSIYATTPTLGGGTGGLGGFNVSALGLGPEWVSVGRSGVAFGVANHSGLSVWQVLQRIDGRARLGTAYLGSSALQRQAEKVLETIL